VRSVVHQPEHAGTDPEKLIKQMKELRIFGLAILEPWGEAKVSARCYAAITEELARRWSEAQSSDAALIPPSLPVAPCDTTLMWSAHPL
jgi:alkylation response protein AidB-like acyl-CoA dehydrogenase